METTFAVDVGLRLREARLAQDLTLRMMAESLGVSPSLISKVETGKSQPSIATLIAITGRLGCSIDEVMGTGTAQPRPASTGLPSLHEGFSPVVERVLQPGESTALRGDRFRHPGTEHAVVLEGAIVLVLDDARLVAGSGDSLCFDARRKHHFVNESARAARLIWFFSGEPPEH